MSAVQTDELTHEISVAAPPEVVFPYFTDPDRMVRWMGTEAELDARPGGAYRIVVAGQHPAAGEYVAVEPPQRVVFTWGWEGSEMPIDPGSTTVEVTLTPEGEGTRVVLVHRDLPADAVAPHAHGWSHYMDRLAVAAAGGETGPDEGPGGM